MAYPPLSLYKQALVNRIDRNCTRFTSLGLLNTKTLFVRRAATVTKAWGAQLLPDWFWPCVEHESTEYFLLLLAQKVYA